MKRWFIALLSMGLGVLGTQISAHHSFPATYIESQLVTIEGEIVQIVLRNPHSFLQVVVKQPTSSPVRYAVEWDGARELVGQGVTRNG